MTIDLEKLEALAKAALWTGNWYDAGCNTVMCTYPADSEFAGESDEIAHPCPTALAAYMAAAQPSAILALIAEIRTLSEDLQAAKLFAHANAEMFKAEIQEAAKLRAALQSIAAIEDKMFGGDWDEIEEARNIANRALNPPQSFDLSV